MEEKVLIKSIPSKNVFKIIAIVCFVLSILALLFSSVEIEYNKNSDLENHLRYSESVEIEGMYYCCYQYRTYNGMIDHFFERHSYGSDFYYGLVSFIVHWSLLGVSLIFAIFWGLASKISLTITDKNVTGKTLVAYLQSKKLDYAKTLLLTTNYSVLEISSLLNYDSLSYFIRIFKQEFGLTPFKFRKNNVGSVFTKNL